MGSVTLYTDTRASYYYFRRQVQSHPADQYIYLLPMNRAVRYLKREIIKQHPDEALLDPPVFTFNTLMKSLHQKFPAAKKSITEAMKIILLRDLMQKKAGELESIQPASSISGVSNLLRRLNQMLKELTQFGYDSTSFNDPPPGVEVKYHDFALLMDSMKQSYRDNLIDETGLIAETITGMDLTFIQTWLPDLRFIYISGYGIYTPLMLRFISQLRQWTDVHIALTYSQSNMHLFDHTANAFEAIQNLGAVQVRKNSEENVLESVLFNSQVTDKPNLPSMPQFHIQRAQNPREEISFIAWKIKQLHFKKNIPLHRIGVTFPNLESYAPLLRIILAEYHLPFNLSTGYSLAQSPLIQMFLETLKIVCENFEVKRLLAWLRSPFMENPYPVELMRLEALLKRHRMQHILPDWTELKKYAARSASNNPDEDTTGFTEFLTGRITALKKLQRKLSATDFQTAFLACLDETGLLNWHQRSAAVLSRTEREKEFRAFNQFIKLLNQMTWILQYMNPQKKYSLHEFVINLREIIQNALYHVREWPEYGIQIMPRLEIQSVELDVLFIGGLNEGVFPRKFVRDIFFNDNEREVMGLNASEDLRSQDKFLFYQLLCSAGRDVFLSYPSYYKETKQIRSSFLDHLSQIFNIRENSEVATECIINEKNILIHAAQKIFEDHSDEWMKQWNILTGRGSAYWLATLRDMYRIFDRQTITEFEGNLTSEKKIINYLNEKITETTFSVSSLESYLFCPMQYFLQRFIGLEPDEEDEDLFPAKERGIILHKIFFRFYTQLKKRNQHHRPWEQKNLLIEIAAEEFGKMPYHGFLWELEQEKFFGSTPELSLWSAFLKSEEAEITGKRHMPAFFELPFGLTGNMNEQSPVMLLKSDNRELKLAGKIDRIDIDSEGRFVVIDYKTGSAADRLTAKEVESGRSLQLPVYIEAARRMLSLKVKSAEPAGGMYYIVGDPDQLRKRLILDEQNITRVWEMVVNTVFDLTEKLASGIFFHTTEPGDARCTNYCVFARICRKDKAKLLLRRDKN